MVERDSLFRWLQGLPELTEDELKVQRRVWSASTAAAMCHEFSSIIISRMAYVVMRPHRFVFNLGYISTGVYGAGMTSVELLFTSMFVELCFEFVVDTITLQIEAGHGERHICQFSAKSVHALSHLKDTRTGIRISTFWKMWHKKRECASSEPHHRRGFAVALCTVAGLTNTTQNSLRILAHAPLANLGGVCLCFASDGHHPNPNLLQISRPLLVYRRWIRTLRRCLR